MSHSGPASSRREAGRNADGRAARTGAQQDTGRPATTTPPRNGEVAATNRAAPAWAFAAQPGTVVVSIGRSSAPCPKPRPGRRRSRTSRGPSRPRRRGSTRRCARPAARDRSAPTCSRAWCAAAPATSRSRCRAGRARATATTPAPTRRTTARPRPARPTAARSGSACARTGSSAWCCASSSSGSSARCASSGSPSSCAPTTASSAATASSPAPGSASRSPSSSARSRPRSRRSRRGSSPSWSPSGSASFASEKQALEEALAGIGAERQEAEEEELAAQLARLPDLGQALREAPAAVKRQVFESFDLQIAYDKAERRVELTATVSEAVADAFENAESPPGGGL